jgi:hypothetical protein
MQTLLVRFAVVLFFFFPFQSYASMNRWLLGTGIVFPSLNGSLTFNSAALPAQTATALGADYLFPEVSGPGSGRTAISSIATGRGSWGVGYGVVSNWIEGAASSSAVTDFAGIGGQFGDLGVGLLARDLILSEGGSLDLRYALRYEAGGGLHLAAVLTSDLNDAQVGVGWRRSSLFCFEINADLPMNSGDNTGLSAGLKGEGQVLGGSLIASSTLSSGSGLSDPTFALALSARLASRLALIFQRPATGLYTVGFNLAL